jgi:hypothetical protein
MPGRLASVLSPQSMGSEVSDGSEDATLDVLWLLDTTCPKAATHQAGTHIRGREAPYLSSAGCALVGGAPACSS